MLKTEQQVMDYLKGKDWTSPTEIGGSAFDSWGHSAKASPVCLRMVKKGYLERNERGWYKIPKKKSK